MRALLHLIKYRLHLEDAMGWMLPEEAESLIRNAAGKERLAEIGVWEGVTTREMRRAMSPTGTIFAIDPYPPGRLGVSYQKIIAAREVARVPNGAAVWLRQTGVAAARHPDVRKAPFDFVFVDGDHTYEGLRGDWEAWSPLVGPGGIIALHDSFLPEGHDDAGSVRYSNEVVAHDPRFEMIDAVSSLRVLRRRSGGHRTPRTG
jgi:predicted O-methyltransferase YrrM